MKRAISTILLSSLLILQVQASRPVKQFAQAELKAPYDAVIVPGVPYADEEWQELLQKRIRWAVLLYQKGLTRHIIFSGSAVYTPYIESEIMRLFALEYGVPDSVIFTEQNAEHSVENVYNSYLLAKEKGFSKVALATDKFQSRMMEWASSNMKVEVDFIPIVEEKLAEKNFRKVQINPSTAYVSDFVSIEDRESFWERLRGTFGKNVEKKSD
jgi:vancomycin permeability regulator SanA